MSSRIDRELATRLNNLNTQNETLKQARDAYLLKEAERKHFEARLIREAMGIDKKSVADSTIRAQSTKEWLQFQQELAKLESAFEFEKLRYDILDKAFTAEYLSMKLDGETIKRQGA